MPAGLRHPAKAGVQGGTLRVGCPWIPACAGMMKWMREEMKTNDHKSREEALRFGADRICLWRLCADAACSRARVCRGDARVCAGLLRYWLEALDVEKRARRSFEDLERGLATVDELRASRLAQGARSFALIRSRLSFVMPEWRGLPGRARQ
jgi:hypothetical protein